MMASGSSAARPLEAPQRAPRPAGRPAPRYRAPGMLDRREEQQRIIREREQQRRQAEASRRRGIALCMALAAVCVVLMGMRIYQHSVITKNSFAIGELNDEIHELTMDAETYEVRIARASADERILSAAERMGMSYPADWQVRAVSR